MRERIPERFRIGVTARSRAALLVCLGALLGACATAEPARPAVAPPSFLQPARPYPRVALVLSGGSTRGFAHIGVLEVLDAHGLKPDLIVGCSAGSIVGALYSSGLTAAEVESRLEGLDLGLLGDVAMPGLGSLASPLGLVRGEGLRRFIDQTARRRAIEEFPMRFAAVATDLATGDVATFNAGDASLAVLASSAIPVLIKPVPIAGKLYGDCQISSPVPVAAARQLGADVVIAVDVVYPPRDARLTSAMRVAFQSLAIAAHRLKAWELAGADIVIAPDLPPTSGQFRFSDRKMIVEAGARATMSMLPRLRPLFERRAPRQ